MRSIVGLAVVVAAVGCNKKTAKKPEAEPAPAPAAAGSGGGSVGAVAPQGNLTVRGGEGAIQAPRMAARRIANQAQMDQLYKMMSVTWQIDNRVPTLDEIMADARKDSQLLALINEKVVVLTGTTQGSGVWAYSQWPQRADEHYAVTASGVGQMPAAELRTRLEEQNSPVVLAK